MLSHQLDGTKECAIFLRMTSLISIFACLPRDSVSCFTGLVYPELSLSRLLKGVYPEDSPKRTLEGCV